MEGATDCGVPVPKGWTVPRASGGVKQKGLELNYGMYLVPGAKAAGKTASLLGMSFWASELGVPSIFRSVLEPRAPDMEDVMNPQAWRDYVKDAMKLARNGFFALDSITHSLARLPAIVENEATIGTQTFKGGLTPKDILGTLLMDGLAREAKVVLFAAINSDLYPVVDQLEGACEGKAVITSPGQLTLSDRISRVPRPLTVPPQYMKKAFACLGYKRDHGGLGQDTSASFA
jgi:hypothetical protein